MKISLIHSAPSFLMAPGLVQPALSALHAISKFAKGELFLIAIPTSSGWFYRIDYPYYSWAETVCVRE
jgi:hypothetical protein